MVSLRHAGRAVACMVVVLCLVCVFAIGCKGSSGTTTGKSPDKAKQGMMEATGGKGLTAPKQGE